MAKSDRTEGKEASSQTSPTRSAIALPSIGTPKWNAHPFGLLRQLASEVENMFDNFGVTSPFGQLPGNTEMYWPQVDMFERNGQIIIRADLPGVRQSDLHVETQDGKLILRGERREDREEEKSQIHCSERSYGTFERQIDLPDNVNADDVRATFNNGILEVTMKAAAALEKPGKRIEIQSSAKPDKAA